MLSSTPCFFPAPRRNPRPITPRLQPRPSPSPRDLYHAHRHRPARPNAQFLPIPALQHQTLRNRVKQKIHSNVLSCNYQPHCRPAVLPYRGGPPPPPPTGDPSASIQIRKIATSCMAECRSEAEANISKKGAFCQYAVSSSGFFRCLVSRHFDSCKIL